MLSKSNVKAKEQKAKRKKIKNCIPSVLSHDIKISGDLLSEGVIEIEGNIEGNVTSLQVNVRTNGTITGDVIADIINVSGEIKGLLKARTINIYKTAKVSGVLVYESIAITDGAFVDGQFKVVQDIEEDDGVTRLNFNEPSKSGLEEDAIEEIRTEPLTNVQ